ncbi:MAG: iron-containing alcohol dehydrogenase, partial [Spirochaetaceae bacterium]
FYFFVDVETNPSSTSVRSCAELLRAKRPEVVFAVGGGSAIDTAKAAIAYLYADDEDAVFRNRFTVPDDRPIFVCVPTTAGSGSEATHFAVVYRDGVKYSIKHPHLKPDVAVLDPTLTLSCPRELTLAAGSDAVCQAVESWWSNGADSTSRARAVQALSALVPNLIRVADKPDDIDAREAMMTGAYAAGRAIDITTTTAGHAMAYGLTTSFGLPHGLAVLAVMRALVAFMSERSALVEVSRALTPIFSPYGGEFAVAFHALTVEIFRRIEWSGYPFPRGTDEIETAAARLAAGVNVERLANHPVSLDDRAIHDLYKTILNDQAARAT